MSMKTIDAWPCTLALHWEGRLTKAEVHAPKHATKEEVASATEMLDDYIPYNAEFKQYSDQLSGSIRIISWEFK